MNLQMIHVPDVTPKSIYPIFEKVKIMELPYFNTKTKLFDEKAFLSRLKRLPPKSCILLESGGWLNNAGVYPNWLQIVETIVKCDLFPIVTSTQFGFVESDLIDLLINKNIEFIVCQEFTHNLGLYDEPIGCMNLITKVCKVWELYFYLTTSL